MSADLTFLLRKHANIPTVSCTFSKIGIILNVDADHLDIFKDLDDIRNSFHLFAKLLPENGTLVINEDIDKIEEITSDLSCRVITFGKEASLDYSAANITYNEGQCLFDVVKDDRMYSTSRSCSWR